MAEPEGDVAALIPLGLKVDRRVNYTHLGSTWSAHNHTGRLCMVVYQIVFQHHLHEHRHDYMQLHCEAPGNIRSYTGRCSTIRCDTACRTHSAISNDQPSCCNSLAIASQSFVRTIFLIFDLYTNSNGRTTNDGFTAPA